MFNESAFKSLLTVEWEVANSLDTPKAWSGILDWLNGANAVLGACNRPDWEKDVKFLWHIALERLSSH